MGEVAVQKSDSIWDQIQRMEDRILRRAYEIFSGNGYLTGRDLDDWLTAERELVWKPAIKLKEKDNQFELQIAVAGVDPRDLKVEVTPEEVLVKGESRTEKKEEKGEIHTSEFQSGSLFRSIHFPVRIDPDKVKAELKNGLLTITAAISEEAKRRKVNIQAA
jgi:HSP20 family protein